MKKFIFVLLASIAAMHVQAQGKSETVTTMFTAGVPDEAKGKQLRAQSNALAELIGERKFAEAEAKASALRKTYEAAFDRTQTQFTFHTRTEYEEFAKTSSAKFEWIDWGYKQCLQTLAFVAAERRDFPAALAMLKLIETIAPVSAGTAVETGYVLNQSGKPAEGLSSYRHALAMAKKYPSQRMYEAASLRGIGFALIDLKRLDEARQAFDESLKIEPGNKVALNELAYSEEVRSAK